MSGEEQFRILHQHWSTCDNQTRAILLTTYAKLANLYEECRPLIAPVFARCTNSVDVEIQQRAGEYASMREAFSPEAVEDLLREMPPFEDNKASALEQRLREKEGADSAAVVKASRPSAAERKRAAQSAAAAQALQDAQRNVEPEAEPEPDESDPYEEEDPVSPMSSKLSPLLIEMLC
jgi:AP-2 complex subunit alpha